MTPKQVRFPGLGIEIDIDNIFLRIGSLEIRWYAVLIATGFLLAVLYAMLTLKKYRLNKDKFLDVIILGLVLGVVGARTYYVIFRLDQYDSFLDMLKIYNGGLAIYGGVIGAAVAGIIGKYWRKLSLCAMLDVTSIGFLIGQCIGRWGNFFNQEAYGAETDLPWGMVMVAENPNTGYISTTGPVHPCFLYESIWCLIGFILLHIMSEKFYKFRGQICLSYVFWYGLGRAWIEGLRTDSLYLIPGVIRVSQLIAILCVLIAPIFLYLGFSGKMFDGVADDFSTIKLRDRERLFVGASEVNANTTITIPDAEETDGNDTDETTKKPNEEDKNDGEDN